MYVVTYIKFITLLNSLKMRQKEIKKICYTLCKFGTGIVLLYTNW